FYIYRTFNHGLYCILEYSECQSEYSECQNYFKTGIYKNYSTRFVPSATLKRYFQKEGEVYKLKEAVKKGVQFKVQNLLHDRPPDNNFDIIFCRNVMIYFDRKTKQRIADDVFAEVLQPDGYLFIGHSESLNYVSSRFKYVRKLNAPVYMLK
ncbi:hypothetical protein LCGC14_2998800, partial [marine sediment metagenome]